MRIGITGGIGAGKSYVSHLLTEYFSIPVYDCDREAKGLMTTSPHIRHQLSALLGVEAYLSDGSLNKPYIAHYLFGDAEHAHRVNAIVHPAVKADFETWATCQEQKNGPQTVVALESAILIEAGMADAVDAVLLVDAPLELRLQRAMRRDGVVREQVEERIRQQASDSAYHQVADYVVINDGRDLLPALENIIQTIIKEKQNHA